MGSESSGLAPELRHAAAERLGIVALVYAASYAISAFLLPVPEHLVALRDPIISFLGLGFVVLAVLLFVAVRMGLIKDDQVAAYGLTFEVIGAVGIEVGVLQWNGDPTLVPLGLSWTCVWIISFPFFVPTPPRRTFVAAMASAFARPAMLVTVTLWRDIPIPDLAITAQFVVPTFVCVGIATLASRVVYGLGKDVTRARQLGSYHLRDKLGSGGMGEVWRAEHRMLARPAAIKLIRPELMGDPAAVNVHLQRFEREVQSTAQLRSPNTIQIYDYGVTSDGVFYYVMELLDGIDLQRTINRYGTLDPARVVHILRQVCHSLGEAHAQGLVHRDIKPANVFLCRYGRELDFAKVLDFGLVKYERHAPGYSGESVTQAGFFTGTPAYASPELARGEHNVIDARSDVYSLGCLGFYLLTGRTVFEAENPMQMLMKQATEEPPAPSTVAPRSVPPSLDRVILDCLAKETADRIQSADELRERLTLVREELPWSLESAIELWRGVGDLVQPARGSHPNRGGTIELSEQGVAL